MKPVITRTAGSTGLRVVLGMLCATAMAMPLDAQSLRFVRRTGGYGVIGFGAGNFRLSCDSGCAGGQLSSTGATLLLGRHFGQRVRAEVGFGFQSNRGENSDLFHASAGAAVYLVGGLHVRGAATYQRASVEDATGTYTGRGAPGFLVGAGYDVPVGRTWVLAPYVSFLAAAVSRIDRAQPGGVTSQTSGRVRALNFGVSLGRIAGSYECTTRRGEVIRLTWRNRVPFAGCLTEAEQRSGGIGIKR